LRQARGHVSTTPGPYDSNHHGGEKPTRIGRKPKFPCRLCKGDHFLLDCPGISKVLEVWSKSSDQSMSSTSGYHVDDKPLNGDHRVEVEKRRVKFPCRLCEGTHRTHVCPHMDEASHLLEEITLIQKKPPTSYRRVSPDPSLVDEVVDPTPSLIDPTLPMKSDLPSVDEVVNPIMLSVNPVPQEASLLLQDSVVAQAQPLVSCQESVLEQPLVNEVVDLNPSLVDPTLPIESDSKIAHVFLVSRIVMGRELLCIIQRYLPQALRYVPLIGIV